LAALLRIYEKPPNCDACVAHSHQGQCAKRRNVPPMVSFESTQSVLETLSLASNQTNTPEPSSFRQSKIDHSFRFQSVSTLVIFFVNGLPKMASTSASVMPSSIRS